MAHVILLCCLWAIAAAGLRLVVRMFVRWAELEPDSIAGRIMRVCRDKE